MKHFLIRTRNVLLAIFVAYPGISIASEEILTVMFVKGEVKSLETGKVLIVGDALQIDEELIFNDEKSLVDAIGPETGRVVLKPDILQRDRQRHKDAFVYLVKNMLFNTSKKLHTRSGDITNDLDLKEYFNEDLLFFDGKHKIKISSEEFPINRDHFFFVSYRYSGIKINKKLSIEPGVIDLNLDDIFYIENKIIDRGLVAEVFVSYFTKDEDSGKVKEYGALKIIDVDKEISGVINIILDKVKNHSKKEKVEIIDSFLNERYGKPCTGCIEKIYM